MLIFYPLTNWDISPSTVVQKSGQCCDRIIGIDSAVSQSQQTTDDSARFVYSAFKTH